MREREAGKAGCGHSVQSVFCALLLIALCVSSVTSQSAEVATGQAVILTLDGAVSPATADYLVRGIRKAADQGAALVVIRMDTPGGLDLSMREIIKEILKAPVPVVTFVAPSGSRAASAGTYILYASHVAAMAPGTNLGAATPIELGMAPEREPAPVTSQPQKDSAQNRGKDDLMSKDTLTRKQVQDAMAYIRSLAQLRGRNVEWAEKAVREAVSLSAEEAQKIKVVDVIARDIPDLLKQLNGRKVTVAGVEHTLATANLQTVEIAPDWRSALLAVITNPSIALILMMIGIYGLIFEFSNPGFVLPGVVGGICLLLGLFALQLLPVNYAGLGLIMLGLVCIVAEAFLPSFGTLGVGGTAALILGAVMLFDPDSDYAVPMPALVAIGMTSAVFVFTTVMLAVRAHRRPIVSGREEIIGAPGVVLGGDFEGEGWARVQGETWRVVSSAPLVSGQKIRVKQIDGLTLTVEPA